MNNWVVLPSKVQKNGAIRSFDPVTDGATFFPDNETVIRMSNNDLQGFCIHKGDVLVFDDSKPAEGDFTILEYNGHKQVAMILGKDCIDYPIICTMFIDYPIVKSLCGPKDTYSLKGKLIERIPGKEGESV